MGYPQIIDFIRIVHCVHYKPSIWGNPILGPPNIIIYIYYILYTLCTVYI